MVPQGAPGLLLPGTGGGGSARYWASFASSMCADYHIFAMEQRGRAESQWATEYSWELVLKDIDAFIDAFGLAPVTLVGHSSGAN